MVLLNPLNAGSQLEFNPDALEVSLFELFPLSLARKTRAVPFRQEGHNIAVAIVDPYDLGATDDVEFALDGFTPHYYVVEEALLNVALTRWARVQASLREGATVAELTPQIEESDLEEGALEDDKGQVAKLVDQLIDQAIEIGASDVHIQPTDVELSVKFRVDGVLRTHQKYPVALTAAIINRVKILSDIDVSERRKPQDGRFNRTLLGRSVDCRVVTLPTSWDLEGAIIRLLDRSRSARQLEELGFHTHITDRLRRVLGAPDGLMLVTGPTGSGKTTTLYAALGLVATPERNTLAIEDPVEIRFPAITQLQVNEQAKLTFVTALRSFLRADPDVMLIGEIRDKETATLSVQAAQTGHLVLSTVHSNSAAATPTRLSNLGLSPYDMGTTLRAVLAQRLVRRVCEHCKIIGEVKPEDLELLSSEAASSLPAEIAYANEKGCPRCDGVGYKGRLLIGELLVVDAEMSQALMRDASAHEISELALNSGMRSLQDDALDWVKSSDTTLAELNRMGLLG